MRRLAVIHPRFALWVPALREAEPRLDIRGWHPREELDWDWLKEAEGLFTWKIPAGVTAGMPKLAWVQNGGAGVDHLVNDASIPPGIPITRADGLFGFWMARYVAGHLLAGAQRLDACAEAQRDGVWASRVIPEDLMDRRALVFGFGRIGRQIGRVLRAMGMDVHGFVSTPREDAEFPLQGPDELPALLAGARLLVLCAPLTPATRNLVDARLLASGGPDLTLVNVGRGEQVVIPDLLAALDAGRLGEAVLDVFPEEPLDPASPLWRHPKVTVTPHHSGPSTPKQMIPDILPNLRRFAEGRPIEGGVDRVKGY